MSAGSGAVSKLSCSRVFRAVSKTEWRPLDANRGLFSQYILPRTLGVRAFLVSREAKMEGGEVSDETAWVSDEV